jgi:Spy/CpxP family protein refolding chaperone
MTLTAVFPARNQEGYSHMRPILMVAICLPGVVTPAFSQHEHSPYASQAGSAIASLSEQEIRDLQTGAGMGLARAAELNRYPGPKHALELSDSLRLTTDQRTALSSIREQMRDRAVALGTRIVDAERTLSTRFQHGHVDSAAVATATRELGLLYGELRFAHLAAHLATKEVLTSEQVVAYDRRRGYASSP